MVNQRPAATRPLSTLLALAAFLVVFQPALAEVTTYALPGGSATAGGISVDPEGNVYSADFGGTQLFRIATDGSISVFATGLNTPSGNAFDSQGNLFQSNYGIGIVNDTVTMIAPDGTATRYLDGLSGPVGIAIDADDTKFIALCDSGRVGRITADGSSGVFAESELFSCPNGITSDEQGFLYVVNFNNGDVLKIDREGSVTRFATIPGGGNGHVAYVAGDLYVADRVGNQIYRVDVVTAAIELYAGTGTAGSVDGENLEALFEEPNAVARNQEGSALFTNGRNNVVRRIGLELDRPSKPTNFKAKARRKGKAKLTWTHDSFNREGFAIELSTAGSKFEEIGRVGPRARRAVVRGLLEGERYRVRIVTFNGTGSSKPSKKVKLTGRG